MPTSFWHDGPLRDAVYAALRPSVDAAAGVAEANNPAPSKIGVKPSTPSKTIGMIRGTGLAHIFELGRKGGYSIQPKKRSGKRALAGKGFGPVAGSRGGAMQARPFLRPAMAWWANGGYQNIARLSLATRGFRAR